jgi:ABC-2 type transport system ATP-binding protein
LSKGYRQRVGIAQAVVHDPPVVILDEPSAGLDPAQRVETRGFIKSLARDHTVILSTHILPDVQEVCSRVLIIHRGRLVADEAMGDLRQGAHSSTRIRLVLRRPAPDAAEKLNALHQVERVRSDNAAEGGHAFLVDLENGDGTTDARETVANFCTREDWGLLELRRERTDLEEMFLRLTVAGHA